jgi:signal transduction histidine kinase
MGILAVSGLLFVVVDVSLRMRLSQLSLPVCIGGLLVLYGYRLDETFTGEAGRTVGKWTVTGVLALFLVGQWYAFLDWYIDQVTTILVFYAAITTGVLFGALIGIYAARVNRSKVQLEDRNEELAASKAQLAEQNNRLEEFTSMVSHDLRNPLQVMGGFLDLAAETGEEEYFERCQEQVDRMHQLIEDMLVLARADENSLSTEPTSLAATTSQVWETMETVDATLDTPDRVLLQADGRQLQHLLENLLKNALNHGRPDVRITVGALSDQAGFYVADDGPGIPADERESIFDHGYSTDPEGTGYGLTIIERIVDVHGWEISVTESTGGGARFEVRGVELSSGPMVDAVDPDDKPGQREEASPPDTLDDQPISTSGKDAREVLQGP